MVIIGVRIGRSSLVRILASSSAVMFVTLFASYAAVRDCTREHKSMVGRSIQKKVRCELLIVAMVILVTT